MAFSQFLATPNTSTLCSKRLKNACGVIMAAYPQVAPPRQSLSYIPRRLPLGLGPFRVYQVCILLIGGTDIKVITDNSTSPLKCKDRKSTRLNSSHLGISY